MLLDFEHHISVRQQQQNEIERAMSSSSSTHTHAYSSLSTRIESLRDSTENTFITCSNVYAFSRNRTQTETTASCSEEEHIASSVLLVANHVELAALVAMRGEEDAVEDAGDVLISLASLLGIEGSASARTKTRAAAVLFENAPYASEGEGQLVRYGELFVRSALATARLAEGGAAIVAAARIFAELLAPWKVLMQGIMRAEAGTEEEEEEEEDEDEKEKIAERTKRLVAEVYSLLCTLELCLAACVVDVKAGDGDLDVRIAERVAAKFAPDDEDHSVKDMKEEGNGSSRSSDGGGHGGAMDVPAHVVVHSRYLLARALMSRARSKTQHQSLREKRELQRRASAAALRCYKDVPDEICYVYTCALYGCLQRDLGGTGGEQALLLARRAVEMTNGRSAEAWILLVLLLTALSRDKVALDTVERAIGLRWARHGFEYVDLLMVKAAIIARSAEPGASSQSVELIIEALKRLSTVVVAVPYGSVAERIASRRREAWELMGDVYLAAGDADRHAECVAQASEASATGRMSLQAMELLDDNAGVALASSLLHDALDADTEDDRAYCALAMLRRASGDDAGAGAALAAAARLEGAKPVLPFTRIAETPF